jgi:hypothetical protein
MGEKIYLQIEIGWTTVASAFYKLESQIGKRVFYFGYIL